MGHSYTLVFVQVVIFPISLVLISYWWFDWQLSPAQRNSIRRLHSLNTEAAFVSGIFWLLCRGKRRHVGHLYFVRMKFEHDARPTILTDPWFAQTNEYLLILVPWYGVHLGVSQEMRAVSDLDVNHPLLGFVLNKLIRYPLYGLSVSPEKQQARWEALWYRLTSVGQIKALAAANSSSWLWYIWENLSGVTHMTALCVPVCDSGAHFLSHATCWATTTRLPAFTLNLNAQVWMPVVPPRPPYMPPPQQQSCMS